MKTYGTAYLTTAVVFLCIDAVWLTVMSSRLYKPLLGPILLDDFNAKAAALFYVIYIAGIVYLAVQPGLRTGSWTIAAMHGAVFGLCAYATYDLTNQATLKNWPVAVTMADICWGTVLTAIAATAGFLVSSGLSRTP
ncbi:DUF2177 family protein [Mesorhizobium sp. BH1-1-4]|uniref:DUF2177 family protein n=1 Tax=Mesorhizobium sp. BH1-1-4 TaxID=2876662 RepID=UPI001CD0FE99|nr:DUF2177 family protein [Mesorhizobium sp. BH1-1-4]MBZ9995702.1 DUF2177 family protein [Mesorhizobium sp. BH1-1-4]